MLAVVTAFVDVRRAEEEVSIRETNVASLKQQVQAAKVRFDAGDVTRTDVAQAEARQAGAESDFAASKAERAAARATYEQIIGRPPIQLAEPPPAPQLPGTVDEAISIARGSNPALAAARAQETAAEKGIGVAKGQLAPKVGIVGSAGMQETYQDRTFRDTNAGLAAELSMAIGGTIVALAAGLVSLVALPAVLHLLGPRIDALAPAGEDLARADYLVYTVAEPRK